MARHWTTHGHGPTWAELAAAFGVAHHGRSHFTAAIRAISRDGWLHSTTAHRSLRPGPRHQPCAPGAEPSHPDPAAEP